MESAWLGKGAEKKVADLLLNFGQRPMKAKRPIVSSFFFSFLRRRHTSLSQRKTRSPAKNSPPMQRALTAGSRPAALRSVSS